MSEGGGSSSLLLASDWQRRRLIDYFIVMGYDQDQLAGRKGAGAGPGAGGGGSLLQRFPSVDWRDTPFIEGLEPFCQPNGWQLKNDKSCPKFHIAVLTNMNGDRRYAAVLTFDEAVILPSGEEVGLDGHPLITSGGGEEDEKMEADNLQSLSLALGHHPMVPGVSLPGLADNSLLFAPKCLLLISRHDDPDLLRNVLGVVYTTYSEGLVGAGGERVRLETVVGNLLGSVYMPPPGGPQVRFSLGATDKMTLQPPMYGQVPVTGTKVAMLFQQMGIRNVLTLFCAAMTELKILFYSQSFNRLTEACTALIALMYPMKYMHVFIPVLPASIGELWSSPTPFIIGVHSSREGEIIDLLDVVRVDLDGGSITIPENMTIHMVPQSLLSKVQLDLCSVLHPDLAVADDAFGRSFSSSASSSSSVRRKPLVSLDKELRAVMLRLMVQLLSGYRSCLTLVRIHPQPYITFHKAAFLGLSNLYDSEFVRRMLECMFFNTFISERGLPWRQCDIFDEAYSAYSDQCVLEQTDPSRVLVHIQMLAEQFYRNENPITTLNQPYSQKIPQPAEGASKRIHQPVFPVLDGQMVTDVMQKGIEKLQLEQLSGSGEVSATPATNAKFVPMGPETGLKNVSDQNNTLCMTVANSARRLDVLRSCIASIFENRISDAKKTFPSVMSTLKTKLARLVLVEELASRKGSFGSTQVLLEHQQFDMVIRLMNAALQDDSDMDIHGIAAALLPLSTVFGRKLSKGVTQFAYTLIQDHAVWQNQAFWEASFFNDVQIGIKTLYQAMHDQNSNATRLNEPSPSQRTSVTSIQSNQASNKRASVSAGPKMGHYVPDNQVVLELAAEEIRGWERLDEAAKAERVSAEEATVYSQALIYINNMISMLCPLELAGSPKRNKRYEDYENASNSISNSMAESDSIDRESGFEEQEIPSNAQQVIKNVLRFADKIGSESSMTTDHMRTIEPMIRTSVTMHVDNLEEVSRQAKRLPPIQKPKINFPSLLPGEELVVSRGLRVYLLPDGREDGNNNEASQTQNAATVVSGGVGGVKLLPAEGALFLTTYRLIFKGNPIDPFAAESIVTRFFPVSSLTREKRFTLNEYLTEIEQQLKEGIQLRSSTFQLIRAAFDDEVTMEDVEMFRKSIQSVQFPEHLFQSFAFRGNHNLYLQEPLSKGKEKHAKYSSTIRGFASKTLKNVTKVTGYNSKSKRKLPNKYFLPNMMPTQGRLSIAEMTNPDGRTIREEDESEAAGGEMGLYPFSLSSSSSAKVTEQRLMERSNFKDWVRVGLLPPEYNVSGISGGSSKSQHNHSETFRTTTINHRYGLCSTYPALLLVPSRVSDDSLQRYSRCHRQSRFPTITWKHPGNHALLVRGAGFHSKGVMGMIRRHQDSSSSSATGHSSVPGSQGEVTVASSVETDLYVNAVIHATPRAMVRPDSSRNMSGSQLSINSLMYGGNSGNSGTLPGGTVSNNDHYSGSQNYPTLTPNMGRKMNPLTKAMDTLTRNSGPPKFGRMTLSNLKGNKTLGSQSSLTSSGAYRGSYRYSESRAEGTLTAEGVARQPELIGGFLQKTALYIFGDKNQIKGAKLESHSKTEFIPIDYPEPRKIRASFKKLMRACVPSGPTNQPEQTFLKQVESSEWLVYLQTLLQISGAVVDLIDSQGASVMVCLEEGWDATCQISSLSMLCLDPFYRTIDGFRVLIEKEWLSAGHRFSHRNNLASNNQDHGFTPVFLQFLDGVHQLLTQFPTAFEFNHFYLKFLAYHHVSCRFRTFLLDCDALRSEIGLFAVDSKRGSFPKTSGGVVTGSDVGNNAQNHSSDEENGGTIYPGGALGGKGNSRNGGTTTLPGSNHVGVDVFDYIESHSSKSPVFFNFLYAAGEFSSDVLRPCSHISNLKIWSYFTGEELKHGASYDLELFTLDQMQEEEYPNNSNDTMSVADGTQNSSAVGYDCSLRTMTDSCSVLLEEIAQLESELGYLPTKWKQIWESLTAPPRLDLGNDRGIGPGVALTTPSSTARNHCRQMHKRSTMELILKGKIGSHAISSSSSSSHPSARASVGVTDYGNSHPFEKHNFPAPSTCEVCGGILWGPVVYGLRCQDCGYSCHEKCRDSVTKICSSKHCSAAGSGLPRDASTDYFGGAAFDQLRQGGDDRGSESQAERRRSQQQHSEDGHHHLYSQFSPGFSSEESNSQIICQGYLNKQANFKIKGWKQRWFVLDATKHQLRYYDTREDFQCKGDIDLSEVNKIVEGYSTPGAPKKAEDGCFFDLVTAKRTFCFCAEGKAAAQDWITKIQSCLST